jgi:hypothetical protein
MLLKAQKNELLGILSSKGIAISNFEPLLQQPYQFGITLKGGIFYFIIKPDEGVATGPFEVETNPRTELPGYVGFNWQGVLRNFEKWSDSINQELNTPDLWAEAAKTAQLFALSATSSDDKLTRTELAEVQGQLRILAQSFATAALPEVAKQKLIELTHTAAVAAETATKRDWVGIVVGSFTGAVFSLALNPTQASEVIKLVKAAFGGLFLH